MPEGTIKKLVTEKGFGFIEADKTDYFFHHSAVEGAAIESLSEGQKVEFESENGPKGPRAEHVRIIEE